METIDTSSLRDQIKKFNIQIDDVSSKINELAGEKTKALEQQKQMKQLLAQVELAKNRLSDLKKTKEVLSKEISDINQSVKEDTVKLSKEMEITEKKNV